MTFLGRLRYDGNLQLEVGCNVAVELDNVDPNNDAMCLIVATNRNQGKFLMRFCQGQDTNSNLNLNRSRRR